jgi:RNA polymerase sigma-70 factor (ECF subfamily)
MSHNPRDLGAKARFATTQWSLVLRAGGGDADTRQALTDLFNAYWYPLYAFCRRQGNADHDAMDLTQGFFTHLLSANALESVSPEKGRFRSFLLASFKNFMANQRRAAATLRRGGTVTTHSLSAEDFQTRYASEPADGETPELLFQRSWVEALLKRVRDRLEEDYSRAGKSELFGLLEPHLTERGEAVPRPEISRRLSLSSAAVAMSIHRMRRRYGELLRQEVASTLDDPADVEDELRALMSVVSSG